MGDDDRGRPSSLRGLFFERRDPEYVVDVAVRVDGRVEAVEWTSVRICSWIDAARRTGAGVDEDEPVRGRERGDVRERRDEGDSVADLGEVAPVPDGVRSRRCRPRPSRACRPAR